MALSEGLNVTEILLSEAEATPDFRVDAEFHQKPPADNPLYQYMPIGDVLESSQYGISIEMNEDGQGFPIYRMNEITDMLCDAEILKCADINEAEAKPFFLNDGDVLFNRTNSQEWVGRTGVYKPFSDEKRIFASYLVRFVPNKKKVLPEYLAAFLNSPLGIWDVKRRARISINQSNVNPEEVKAIRIPLLALKIQEKIATNFTEAQKAIEKSNALYTQAETLLLDALKLTNWHPPVTNNYTVHSGAVWDAGRFDADHFHPKYDVLREHLQAFKGSVHLGELCPNPVNGVEVREYEEEGVPYLRVGDIRNFSIDLQTVKRISVVDAAREIEKVRLRSGDVLVSRSGSLGVIGVVQPHWEHAVISSHLIRVRFDYAEFDPYFVACFLSSRIGKMQIDKFTNGGVQPEINQSALKSLFIPKLPMPQQKQIRASIEAAYKHRERANSLLERAKRAVEVAIEQNEAAGLSLLEEK